MITVHLDKHDLLYHIEGFARGSHLRQHIWQNIVEQYIPQMDQDEIDFTWYYLRRDIWPLFFGRREMRFSAEDFLQCMAALHRNNHYNVTLEDMNGKRIEDRCYMFQHRFYPLHSFKIFYNQDRIVDANRISFNTTNKYLDDRHMLWWDLPDIYNEIPSKIYAIDYENN